jgi:hypothetical protein
MVRRHFEKVWDEYSSPFVNGSYSPHMGGRRGYSYDDDDTDDTDDDDKQTVLPSPNLSTLPPQGENTPPPMLSEYSLHFLDGVDEVPPHLRIKLWGLFSRMHQLTNIFSLAELDRCRTITRTVTRPMRWRGDITFLEEMQIQNYVNDMALKSWQQRERKLLAPQLQELTKTEFTHNEPPPHPRFGLLKAMWSRVWGGR